MYNFIILSQKYSDYLALAQALKIPFYEFLEKGFGYNPLEYPLNLRRREQWINTLGDLMGEAFLFFTASKTLLIELLMYTYEVYEWKENPTMYDALYVLRNHYHKFSQKTREYFDVLENRIKIMLYSAKETLHVRRGTVAHHIEHEESFVLSLAGLPLEVFRFVSLGIFYYLYYHCMEMGPAKEGEIRWVIVFEEAQNLLRSLGKDFISNLPLAVVRSREYGLSAVFVSQFPSEMESSLKSMTSNRIVFSLGSGQDIVDVRQMLQLTEDESRFINHLGIGEAIVTKQDYPYPFPVNFPKWSPDIFGDET